MLVVSWVLTKANSDIPCLVTKENITYQSVVIQDFALMYTVEQPLCLVTLCVDLPQQIHEDAPPNSA